jgi:cytidylate kinase
MKNLYKVDLQDVYTYTVVIEAENEEEVKQKSNEILEHHRKEFNIYMSQYPGVDLNDKRTV